MSLFGHKFFIGYAIMRFHRKMCLFKIFFFIWHLMSFMQYSISHCQTYILTLPFAFVMCYRLSNPLDQTLQMAPWQINKGHQSWRSFTLIPWFNLLLAIKNEEVNFLMFPLKWNKACCDLAYFLCTLKNVWHFAFLEFFKSHL